MKSALKITKAGVFAVLAVVVIVSALWPREPKYGGKRLSQWIDRYPRNIPEARAAIREIGPDALPHLARMVGRKESVLKSNVLQMLNRLPFVTIKTVPAAETRSWAAQAVLALGTNAAPVVPELARLVKDPETAKDAVVALSEVGAAALPVLTNVARHTNQDVRSAAAKALLSLSYRPEGQSYANQLAPLFLTNLHDGFWLIRADCAGAIPRFVDAETGVAALTTNLQDTNSYVRAMTAQALGAYGLAASRTAPEVRKLLESTNQFERGRAEWALERIAPPVQKKLDQSEAPAK